jgi:phospholipase C
LWDDWGGWFDHVEPPQIDAMGLGFRVPLIVVSPYAKRGYVSHVQHEFGSILHFTEETFGLVALAASDARADDFSDCFDFRQSPQPFARFRTTRSPAYFLRQRPDGRGPDDD